jgi:hypothetical protein
LRADNPAVSLGALGRATAVEKVDRYASFTRSATGPDGTCHGGDDTQPHDSKANRATRTLGGSNSVASFDRAQRDGGVVKLSETSLILAIDRQTKSLKSLASVFAVVGNFRSI